MAAIIQSLESTNLGRQDPRRFTEITKEKKCLTNQEIE